MAKRKKTTKVKRSWVGLQINLVTTKSGNLKTKSKRKKVTRL